MSRLLALRVEAGVEDQSYEGNSMFTLFSINVTLTEAGFKNIEVVLKAIFSFLLVLKETSMEEHEKAFLELKQIKDTSFKYREEKTATDNVEELSVNLMYYEASDILCGPDIFFKFDSTLIQNMIERLNERKFNLLLLTNKHEKYEKTEKWFGTEYDVVGEFVMRFGVKRQFQVFILFFQTSLKALSACGTTVNSTPNFQCQRRTSSSATTLTSSPINWIHWSFLNILKDCLKTISSRAFTSLTEGSSCRTHSSLFISCLREPFHQLSKWF